MESVKAECGSCGGTGVYSGFAEPKGVGVVCLNCKGTGCREIQYIPFTKRKHRNGIKKVRLSRGSFILSCGPHGEEISYSKFLSGKIPSVKK